LFFYLIHYTHTETQNDKNHGFAAQWTIPRLLKSHGSEFTEHKYGHNTPSHKFNPSHGHAPMCDEADQLERRSNRADHPTSCSRPSNDPARNQALELPFQPRVRVPLSWKRPYGCGASETTAFFSRQWRCTETPIAK